MKGQSTWLLFVFLLQVGEHIYFLNKCTVCYSGHQSVKLHNAVTFQMLHHVVTFQNVISYHNIILLHMIHVTL